MVEVEEELLFGFAGGVTAGLVFLLRFLLFVTAAILRFFFFWFFRFVTATAHALFPFLEII